MTLNEFINLSECEETENGEHHVTFAVKDQEQRCGVYVSDPVSEYDSKERAFLYLKQVVEGE